MAARIGHIGARPLMYGGTADGVDTILRNYHELWAVIHGREGEFQEVVLAAHMAEGCGARDFAGHHRQSHPDIPEAEVARYVVGRWREIGERLGIPAAAP